MDEDYGQGPEGFGGDRSLKILWCLLIVVPVNNARVEVYFSPKGGCTERAVRLIDGGKRDIKIQAYSFTSKPIFEAILRAEKRGAKVDIILDRRTNIRNAMIANGGLTSVWFDGKHAIAHNKLIIIDREIVIGGSFNYSASAENRNAENMTVIRSEEIAREYLENWMKHLDHSEH